MESESKSKYICQCHELPAWHHKGLFKTADGHTVKGPGTWSCQVTGKKCKLVGRGPKAGKPGEGKADRSGQGKTGQGKGQKGQKG